MDIMQLRYFVKVCEQLNITNAACELHVAQPSLSQSISRLEDEIGVPLFIRSKKRLKPSVYGELFYSRVVSILKQLDDANQEIITLSQTIDSPLTIKVWMSSSICTNAILAFQERYPYINIHVVQKPNNEDQNGELEEDYYDMALTTGSPEDIPPAPSEVVFSEEIVLAVNKNNELADLSTVTLQELEDKPFILLDKDRPYSKLVIRMCRQAGFTPKIVMENDTALTLTHMLSLNIGIGIVPEHTWNLMPSEKIKFIKIKSPVCIRTINLNWPGDREMTYSAKLFREFVEDYFKDKYK